MDVERSPARQVAARVLGVLALCLALAAGSLQAHRPDCHLKLRSDCGACLAGSTTASLDAPPAVDPRPLQPVATLEADSRSLPRQTVPLRLSGRAPPA